MCDIGKLIANLRTKIDYVLIYRFVPLFSGFLCDLISMFAVGVILLDMFAGKSAPFGDLTSLSFQLSGFALVSIVFEKAKVNDTKLLHKGLLNICLNFFLAGICFLFSQYTLEFVTFNISNSPQTIFQSLDTLPVPGHFLALLLLFIVPVVGALYLSNGLKSFVSLLVFELHKKE